MVIQLRMSEDNSPEYELRNTSDDDLSQSSNAIASRPPASPIAPSPARNSTDLPLSPDTWKALKLDDYLTNYPGGANLTLQDYAFAHQAQNFICGIGEGCHAGQLGNPVSAPDWYVLYAAQEWNAVQNSIYTAIGFAVSMVQATAGSMITDLFGTKSHSVFFYLQDFFILISAVAFTVAMISIFAGAATVLVASVAAGAIAAGASSVFTGVNLYQSWDRTPDAFTRWSSYVYYLSEWQSKVQDKLANMTSTTIQSGISSPLGIANALKGGVFLNGTQVAEQQDVQKQIEKTLAVRILVDIIRTQGGYVTYKSDPCNGKGPNGAWKGDEYLSFCKDGTMMNIVKANGKKTDNKWYNARAIADKYNITTEYLVTQSWNCFQKYKTFGYDPYRNATLPTDPNSECVANLPVCDCTDPAIVRARHKGHSTTRACREQGKLPI
ncbi:hypothetical protein PCANC_02999 [Puccinia coronata f. sp. avenae]|uniref:DUF7872 domain-containing protein n=1 Tax=Puccinia coronata f. sp. avenae TaxID=200324 RepID=A0A2N5W0Z9_9BASI|nr:hypothetical protein PCANC_09231 [Puccinia coronata f. sp. avenae]PLW42476.1 hypothetical protein PCASD_04658 [Puccinia coronata f. sp. avenae]PLW55926.1 hypothetical protein PCANC_02999 [Puccinia coronata f. sp. avenae]